MADKAGKKKNQKTKKNKGKKKVVNLGQSADMIGTSVSGTGLDPDTDSATGALAPKFIQNEENFPQLDINARFRKNSNISSEIDISMQLIDPPRVSGGKNDNLPISGDKNDNKGVSAKKKDDIDTHDWVLDGGRPQTKPEYKKIQTEQKSSPKITLSSVDTPRYQNTGLKEKQEKKNHHTENPKKKVKGQTWQGKPDVTHETHPLMDQILGYPYKKDSVKRSNTMKFPGDHRVDSPDLGKQDFTPDATQVKAKPKFFPEDKR